MTPHLRFHQLLKRQQNNQKKKQKLYKERAIEKAFLCLCHMDNARMVYTEKG